MKFLKAAERFLELFMYEGMTIIFQLALAYFKLNEKEILGSDDFGQTFMLLQNITMTTDWQQVIRVSFSSIYGNLW